MTDDVEAPRKFSCLVGRACWAAVEVSHADCRNLTEGVVLV